MLETITTTQQKSTEIIPVISTWKHNPLISSKETQVKESLVTNITDLKNKTINWTQHPRCQRRTPAHRQQDWLYINYQLDALIIILFIKYYSPLHVSSITCSSSGGLSCIQAAYGTVTLYKSPGGLSICS